MLSVIYKPAMMRVAASVQISGTDILFLVSGSFTAGVNEKSSLNYELSCEVLIRLPTICLAVSTNMFDQLTILDMRTDSSVLLGTKGRSIWIPKCLFLSSIDSIRGRLVSSDNISNDWLNTRLAIISNVE